MRKTIITLLLSAFMLALPYIASSADTPAATSVTYTLQLKAGANFVSVPLSFDGSAPIENIFNGALEKVQSIEYFDTSLGKWQIFVPGSVGEQELQELGDAIAFYIYAREDMAITIYGRSSAFLQPALSAGWNAIGVVQPISVSEFASKVNGFNADYDSIYRLDEKGVLIALKLSDTMVPGTGYWLDNDPDGDGVASSVELAIYKSSPSTNDLVRDEQGQFKKKAGSEGKEAAKADDKKPADVAPEDAEYTIPGDDEKLGGFTITRVRYKADGSGKKIAGIGRLQPDALPADLKPLLSFIKEEKVFLDLKDEKILRAVGETLNGFTVGGAAGLSFDGTNAKLDLMTIDADGSVEIGLTAKVGPIPERIYFVRWSPDDRKGFIQLSLLLGDEEEPGDEVTASRVWYTKEGKAEAFVSGVNSWLLNLPPSASGVFEPYVNEMMITNSLSPFIGNDVAKPAWLPASPEVSGNGLRFTGPVSNVRFMSALGATDGMLNISEQVIRADEMGFISINGRIGDLDRAVEYRFEKGAFVMKDPAVGLALYFEGWKRKPEVTTSGKRIVTSWKPSLKVFWGYQSDDVLKEVSIAVPLSVQVGTAVEKKDSIKETVKGALKDVKPRLLGFGFGLDGKLVLNFDGYETGVNAGIERKEEEVSKSGQEKKMLVSTLTTLKFGALTTADIEVVFNVGVKEQYINTVPEASQTTGSPSLPVNDREGYQSRIGLSGEGRYRLSADVPLVGGSDLAASYNGELQYKGKDKDDKRKYLATTRVSLGLAESADNSREEDGWRFSVDDLSLELEEVEVTGADNQLQAIMKYLKPTAPKGVKRFSGFVTLNPPADFIAAGPFEGALTAERISSLSDAAQKWRVAVSAEVNVRLDLDGGDNNYLLLKELVGLKETGQNWNFGAAAELHLGDKVIAGDLFFQKGGIFTLVVNGYDLDDTFKGVDLMVDFRKGAGDKWLWSASLGGTISGASLASLLGQDASLVTEDIYLKGTYTADRIVLELSNLPASWDGSMVPDWLILDKVKNITFVRQKMADGTVDKYFSFDMDMIFPKFVDESKPKEQWPRFTLGAVFSSKGLAISGRNLGPIDTGNGNSLTILEAGASFSKDDPEANKKVRLAGKVQVTMPSSWRDAFAKIVTLPEVQTIFFEYGPAGFSAGVTLPDAKDIVIAKSISMKAKEFLITKQSPWGMGIRTEISVGGAKYEGTIGVQDGKARFTLPPDLAVTLNIAEGFVADLRNLNIVLAGEIAMAADATLSVPENNAMRAIVGDKLSAKLEGSAKQFSLSTYTSIYSSMDMGLLGKAEYFITKLSLSSDGAFAGSGNLTLRGQKTDFVIGTKSGGLYFLVNFGEKGIEAKLAQIFTLKLKKSMGLEAMGPYQYLRADDLTAGLGNNMAGADLATSKFLYFLPSSVPPVGFAFFDKLEGEVHIAGFGVNIGMSLPAPKPKDIGTVAGVLGQAITGGNVDWTTLDTLSAPAFSVRDVYMKLPKVPGYAWKNGKLQYTDNLFKDIFGKDKLEIVKTASLKPKDFVQVLTADDPMDVIKVMVPADKRKGTMALDFRGFKTSVDYDLRSDELIYEKKSVKKLPELYTLIKKLQYVDKNAGELPEELKQSGGAQSKGTGVSAERTKTVEVVMPNEQGGGKAQVTWKVEDINAELKAIKDMLSAVTPAPNTKWEDHLSSVWKQFSQKGLSFSGNRASFKYSPSVTAELELTEYDSSLDITGIKYADNKLYARFGTVTLYADKNFEGKSVTVTDDVPLKTLKKSVIGNDSLSSIKIEGRGKAVIYQDDFSGESAELTGSLDSFDDSNVKDNSVSSMKLYYEISTNQVTGWRMVFKSDKGVVTRIDAGGVEVVFPDESRLLSLLPNSRLLKAKGDTENILKDLQPYPQINSNPTGFISSFWNNRVLPLKAGYIDSESDEDTGATEKPVEFRKADGSVIGFMPLKYGEDMSVTGLRFDKTSGTLSGKFGKATLYEHANYEGKSLVVDDDIPDLGETILGNDSVSSVKVDNGVTATLFSGTNYTERWYYDYTDIKSGHSGMCLDVEGAGKQNGARTLQWYCHGGNNQQWRLVPVGDDYYNIVAKHSGKCLEVEGENTDSYARVQQWECNEGDNQAWKLVPKGGGYYQLRARHSGKCADVFTVWKWFGDLGASVIQSDCYDTYKQKWLVKLDKEVISKAILDKNTSWLGGSAIGNDAVRSVSVYSPLDIKNVKEWKVLQSTPSGGNVILANVKDADKKYKSVISTELQGTANNIQSYYDDKGSLTITAYAGSGMEFPAENYRVYVTGTPHELKDITEASQYVRIVTKSIKLPGGATAVINQSGGISALYQGVAITPDEDAPAITAFTLDGPDGMDLGFNITKNSGFGAAEIVGSNPVQYAPLYADDSGVPQGIKKVIGKIEGGFFVDAGLNLGTAKTVQVNLHVSGAIKTDGNYYLKGNGNLVIANFEVSEAVIELSSDKGLLIRGKLDLYGTKVDIAGTLTPDNKFSFTGMVQVMISGNGIKGAMEVSNSGVTVNGGIYLANKKVVRGGFEVKDGAVSWPTNVSIGIAGFDSTVKIGLKEGSASYSGRAYINVDIPIYVWGPTGWKCKRVWGVKICWPRGWGNIRVGTIGIHHNATVKGSIDGTSVGIKLGIATLSVDVAKPKVSAKW